ncbi:hypothetical protein [Halomonas sp. PR-M31]|uniref:hypothetical protein n=1 Tax=Halomonas sp. PR-M31 TaxID=1471202 RepID=UPI000A756195|nr:hypothetical protein [Halomonas sp. PR-M31]
MAAMVIPGALYGQARMAAKSAIKDGAVIARENHFNERERQFSGEPDLSGDG